MLPILETERLVLRPRTAAHLDACIAMDSDPEVTRYVGGPWDDPEAYRRHLAQRIVAAYPEGLGYWSIFPKPDPGDFLGWVALVPLDEDGAEVEIGWRIKRSAWGKGYAPEAAGALVRHAFQTAGLSRIVATMHPQNAASFRVAEKIGLRFARDGSYLGEPCKIFELARAGF